VFYHTGGTGMFFHQDGSMDFVDCENVKQLLELTTVPPK
jgi:hypothetical protein